MRSTLLLAALLLLAVPAQACSLASAPAGPGVLYVETWDGTTTYRIDVPERGLDADCSIMVPLALGDDRVVWQQGQQMHELDLATGERTQWDAGMAVGRLRIEDGDIVGLFREPDAYRGPWQAFVLSPEGPTRAHIFLEEPDRRWDRGWNVTVLSWRSGEPMIDMHPPDHPEFPRDNMHWTHTDGHYAVYFVGGQMRRVDALWNNATQEWSTVEGGHDGYNAAMARGVIVSADDQMLHFHDVANGERWNRSAPWGNIMAINDHWVVLGVYAEEYRDWPLGIPAPAAWLAVAAALVLARRR